MPKQSSNVDGTILENCFPDQLISGKSYIDYLKVTGQKLNVDTLAIFLKLYYTSHKHGTEITARDQQEITDMFVLNLMNLMHRKWNGCLIVGANIYSKSVLFLTLHPAQQLFKAWC